MKTATIGTGQWLSVVVLCRLATDLTFSPAASSATDWWSVVIYGVLYALLLMPSFWLARKTGDDPLHAAARLGRGWGTVTAMIGATFALYILCVQSLQFTHFIREALSPDLSATALCVAMTAAVFWSAFYGIEALARAALPIAVLTGLSVCAVLILLIPEMRAGYLFEALSSTATAEGWMSELVRSSELVAAGWMLSHIGHRPRCRTALVTATLVSAAVLLIRIPVTGVFGRQSAAFLFPYHTAVMAADGGLIERIDLAAVSVWVAATFLKMALFAWLFFECLQTMLGKRCRKIAAPIGTAVVCVCGTLLGGRIDAAAGTILTAITLGGILLLNGILPLIIGTRRHFS